MRKILVVDDSPMDRHLVGSLIAKHSENHRAERAFNVLYASDGKEALQVVQREQPALVITDLQMPNMDGLDLVEAIKSAHPFIPVILLTAHGSEEIAIKALERGASSYVVKRRLAADLIDAIEDTLEVFGTKQEQQRVLDQLWLTSEAHFLLPNDLSNIAPVIGLLQDNLTRLGAADDRELGRIGVALREALSNAIIHGNLEISSQLRETDEPAYYRLIDERSQQPPYRDRTVALVARESRAEAVYIVRDEGRGFDTNSLPDPIDPANLERNCGRGLLLIQTFMDEVVFNESGNQITMIKRRRRRIV